MVLPLFQLLSVSGFGIRKSRLLSQRPLTRRPVPLIYIDMSKHKLGEPRHVRADRKRDSEILALREAGWTLERIGQAYGVTRQRVAAILQRLAKQ